MKNSTFFLIVVIVSLISLIPLVQAVANGTIQNERGYFHNMFGAGTEALASSSGPLAVQGGVVTLGDTSYDHSSSAIFSFDFWDAPYFNDLARSASTVELDLDVGNPRFEGNLSVVGKSPSYLNIRFNNQTLLYDNLTTPYQGNDSYTWALSQQSTNGTVSLRFPVDSLLLRPSNPLDFVLGPNTKMSINSVSIVIATYVENLKTPYLSRFPGVLIGLAALGGVAVLLLFVVILVRRIATEGLASSA